MWSAELYNCNAFVADIAKYMGLKVPSSTLIYPKIFVNHLRMLNTGHPEADETLVSDNVKEMSSPTRDGRAMIDNHVYTIGPDGTPTSAVAAGAPTSAPKVTIGSLRVSNSKTPAFDRAIPLIDGRNVQATKFGIFAALAVGFALSACATTPSPESPLASSGTPGAAISIGERDLTPQEKKAIVDAVSPSLRDPGSAKYKWAKFPVVVTEELGQLLRHRRRQEPVSRLQRPTSLYRRSARSWAAR